jgi:hypothetical protein
MLIHHYPGCASSFPAVDVLSGYSMSLQCRCKPKPMEEECWKCKGTGKCSD